MLEAFSVREFLVERASSQATKVRERWALQRLALYLNMLQPQRRLDIDTLKQIDLNSLSAETDYSHTPNALTVVQVRALLRMWDGSSAVHKRNKAIIAVLFGTGMTSSELTSLRWTEIDLMNGVITLHHPDGSVSHEVAIFDTAPLLALQAWYEVCGVTRQFVFCRIRQTGDLGADQPMSGGALAAITAQTSQHLGFHCSPADARKTFAMMAIANGMTPGDLMAQLGYKSTSMVAKYFLAK